MTEMFSSLSFSEQNLLKPIVDSLLLTLHASANRILHCEASSFSFFSRAAALVSRVSRLSRSTLARACTPLTKSEEKDRLLAVYF